MSFLIPLPRSHRLELKALGQLLLPILVTQLSQAAFGFVDTVMAGQASPLDLAAVALGASLWLPLVLLVGGILMATTPLVAAAWGRQDAGAIPVIVHQALWLALFIGVAGALLLHQIGPVFVWLDTPAHLREMAERYLAAMAFGLPAMAAFSVLRCYCEAMAKPLPVTVISIVGLLVNIPLNDIFIHGRLGAPALGGVGCGVASAISMWLMLMLLAGYVLSARAFASTRLLQIRSRPEWARLKPFLKLGLPIGIAIFFEVSVFALVAVLISPLGELQVAGHQIALSVTSLLFMFPLSMAFAMTIRVGQAFGRQDMDAIRQTRRSGLIALGLFACLTASFIVLTRHSLAGVYTDDINVRTLAADLLLFAAAYQVVDALQVGAAGCLRGLQDSKGPMILTLISYWLIALPLGYGLGMTQVFGQSFGPHGFWTGLVLGLTVAAILLNGRLTRQLRRLHRQGFPAARH